MGSEISIDYLWWATKIIEKNCEIPPAHPSRYFMTGPLRNIKDRFAICDALIRTLYYNLFNCPTNW